MDKPHGKVTHLCSFNNNEDLVGIFFKAIKNSLVRQNLVNDGILYGIWELVLVSGNLNEDEKRILFILLLLLQIHDNNGSTGLPILTNSQTSLKNVFDNEFNFELLKPYFHSSETLVKDIINNITSGTFSLLIGSPPPNLLEDKYAKKEPIETKPVILHHDILYLEKNFSLENLIAHKIKTFLDHPCSNEKTKLKTCELWLNPKEKTLLDEKQIKAVESGVNNRFSIISGGPGTGKTIVISALISELSHIHRAPGSYVLTAFTGKAAFNLGNSVKTIFNNIPDPSEFEKTFYKKAKILTIHRLLEYSPNTYKFKFNKNNRLPYKVIIIDEASMVSLYLFNSLLAAMRDDAKLVLVGDANQLPSIESGAVLRDLVFFKNEENAKGNYPEKLRAVTTILTKNHRSSNEINIFANNIIHINDKLTPETIVKNLTRGGKNNEKEDNGVIIEDKLSIEDFLTNRMSKMEYIKRINLCLNKIFSVETENILENTLELQSIFQDIEFGKILTSHNYGFSGSIKINTWFHNKLSQQFQQTDKFFPGEPVMITKNDYYHNLFNGDQGIILNVEQYKNAVTPMAVFKTDGYLRSFPVSSISRSLIHSFAITIHKSQGSEYKDIAIVLSSDKNLHLTRELLYTAVTRARSRAVFIAQKETIVSSLKNKTIRTTLLSNLF